jgi:CDP-diglyceride synthetase
MQTRIISGVIALSILAVLLFLPPYVLAILVLTVSIIGLVEFSKAMKQKNIQIDLPVSIVATAAIMGKAYGSTLPKQLFPVLSDVFTAIFASQHLNALI